MEQDFGNALEIEIIVNQLHGEYASKDVPFGFGSFSEVIFRRTYSRRKPDNTFETWNDTISRVVRETFSQACKLLKTDLGPLDLRLNLDIREFYDDLFNLRWLPGGRGLWAMGTPITDKGHNEALNNCCFIKTEKHHAYPVSEPFRVAMQYLMEGVGVGWDTSLVECEYRVLGCHGLDEPNCPSLLFADEINPEDPRDFEIFTIEDSREGWAEAVAHFINEHIVHQKDFETFPIPVSHLTCYDLSKIRPKGEKLNTFGGVSSGPEPLKKLFIQLHSVFEKNATYFVTTTLVADIMNIIGVCVVAGGMRRSAQIGLSNCFNEEFIEIKDYSQPRFAYRAAFGWTSNNSIDFASDIKYNENRLDKIVEGIFRNGEPGIFLRYNCRFGRLLPNVNNRLQESTIRKNFENGSIGTNPCGEITLESYELCNLADINFPLLMKSGTRMQLRTLRNVLFYCKVVSLMEPSHPLTKEIVSKNHRIGIGLTGISEVISEEFKIINAPVEDYKRTQFDFVRTMLQNQLNLLFHSLLDIEKGMIAFGFPESIKLTTIKPCGTLSLLFGCSPGIHFSYGKRVKRRVRFSKTDLRNIEFCKSMGIPFEDDVVCSDNIIGSFPLEYPADCTELHHDVIAQFELLKLFQGYWADNNVSMTINVPTDYPPEELKKNILEYSPYIKCVSFLPFEVDTNAVPYAQPPIQILNFQEWHDFLEEIQRNKDSYVTCQDSCVINLDEEEDDTPPPNACSNEKCELPLK